MKHFVLVTVSVTYLFLFPIKTFSVTQRPHIIFIIADDLGWNDVGWHNPRMLTPNLDTLASQGVILNQSYVQPTCTPSRAALMTGYYPFHTGRQNHVLHPLMPSGIPLRFVFLPEKLREAGYTTHMVGKWHLGYCNWRYTPNQRGFDSFFGFYTGSLDYFSHTGNPNGLPLNSPEVEVGLDLRNNSKVLKNKNGVYSTNLFSDAADEIIRTHDTQIPLFLLLSFQAAHSPLQVPKFYEDLYTTVSDKKRRKFSGMVTAMDEAIGRVIFRLKDKSMLDNSLIIFTTDNGGQTSAGGNNWPLRGNKGTLWEGGNRALTFVWGSPLSRTPRISYKLFHIVDWFPTLLHIAGVDPEPGIDGVNQWDMISNDSPEVRNEIVYNIYDLKPQRAALRIGNYKLIEGFPGNPSGWIAAPHTSESKTVECNIRRETVEFNTTQSVLRLYNIIEDPLERHNIYKDHPDLIRQMKSRLEELRSTMFPADDPPPNDLGHPRLWEGTFSPGWCTAT